MKKKFYYFILLSVIVGFVSCATKAQHGSRDEWSAEMHFKVAQDAANRRAYKEALREYDEILTKYQDQFDKVAMANYERAVIYFRMKDYEKAHELLTELSGQLQNPMMPGWVRVMVPIMLEQVESKINATAEKKKKAAEKKAAKEQAKEAKAQLKKEKNKKEEEKTTPKPDAKEEEERDGVNGESNEENPDEEERDSPPTWIPFEPVAPSN
ncbi:hypothetical protein PVA45_06505 [Entomospira entomophila]|uniref:Tetratricopeptide repeat protein n=1 Tax=Entomospira entomophila TaxID=2719988 RepID=A0A968G9N9_9SPIO|nr:hypothetical protein [Entomospira entomophilus]NIZ41150.1 hypothetical protein [Entomospira entomophilus]WDI35357.1 hypothetical protein PVA45_06505 [Entomospira entomophilus]